jgi:hypothetical protein
MDVLTPNDLRELVAEGGRNPSLGPHQRRQALADAIDALAGAGPDDVVAAAVTGLTSDDRNVRAAMLRVLALFDTPPATEGVLRGLADPVRRVRDAAIRAAQPHHLAVPAVVATLRRITEDEHETDRLRRTAFFVLSSATARQALPAVTREAIGALAASSRFREPLLRRLCSMRTHTVETRALLHDFVRTGSKDEAVMATRALCDQVLLRTDIVPEAERRRIRADFDRGHDDLHRWVPATTVAALFAQPAPD